MKAIHSEYLFTSASESELNELVAGRESGAALPWPSEFDRVFRVGSCFVGVLFRESLSDHQPICPLALVVAPEDGRRLFSRFSQLRSDLSPLSSWCNIVSPKQFAALEHPIREARLDGFDAAWIGLTIAEAQLLAERSPARLRVAACFATQTYAIARILALWDSVPIRQTLEKYDSLQQLIRTSQSGAIGIRGTLEPIWLSLSAAMESSRHYVPQYSELRTVVNALLALREARLSNF